MRDPDENDLLDIDCPALKWVTAGIDAAMKYARFAGVSEKQIDSVQARNDAMIAGLDMEARAWKIDLTKARKRQPNNGAVASWLINGPFHPHWSWWHMVCVHLRDVPGVDPPKVLRPGMTHEFIIFAVDPTRCPKPDIDLLEGCHQQHFPLTPLDLAHQVILGDDEQADELLHLMVKEVVAGRTAPDSDFREEWQAMLDATSEHLRYGNHPDLN